MADEMATHSGKPHAPEGQGWLLRSRGAAAAPWCIPGKIFHPWDQVLPPALTHSQEGRRCMIAAVGAGSEGTCAFHPNAMERGHAPSREGWKR